MATNRPLYFKSLKSIYNFYAVTSKQLLPTYMSKMHLRTQLLQQLKYIVSSGAWIWDRLPMESPRLKAKAKESMIIQDVAVKATTTKATEADMLGIISQKNSKGISSSLRGICLITPMLPMHEKYIIPLKNAWTINSCQGAQKWDILSKRKNPSHMLSLSIQARSGIRQGSVQGGINPLQGTCKSSNKKSHGSWWKMQIQI